MNAASPDDPTAAPYPTPLVVFAGGGTGGHVYPALAVIEALREKNPHTRFLFFATPRETDSTILAHARIDLVQQPLRPLSLRPHRWPAAWNGIRRSRRLCRQRFARDRPAVVIGTGGLASYPAIREALRSGVPTALLNPDAVPGRANRFLARRVEQIFAQWPQTRRYLPRIARGRVAVTGCPVRPRFRDATRAQGIQRFNLDPTRETLLITGASQGARSINRALAAILNHLETAMQWQILHLTGHADFDHVQRSYAGRRLRAVVQPYTQHMPEAMSAADLIVARAGASTLAEITCAGRAAILLPYPYHRDQHQLVNARCLADEGAARILRDAVDPRVNGPALWQALQALMHDDEVRARMAASARRIARPNAANDVANLVANLLVKSAPSAPLDPVQPIG